MSFTDYEKEPSEKFESPPPKSSKYKRGVVTTPTSYYYILYNDQVCEIDASVTDRSHLSVILSILSKNLSPDLWLWVAVPLTKKTCVLQTKKFVEEGFEAPYIGGSTPFGKKIPHSACLLRKNVLAEASDPKRGMLNVMYIIQQYTLGEDTCSLFARFNTQAISFLRKTSKMGHTKNGNGLMTQKELGGQLYVENIEESGGKYVFVIGVDKDNVASGVEEEVMVSPTRYNFHSHPKEAYVRHAVEYGWPSVTDYLGYLTLGNNTIFHCVATLEGLYILSFGPHWVNRLKEVNKKFVKKNYDIRGQGLNPTPFEYVKIINGIQVDGYPLFLVKFLPWNGASRTIFGVTYKKGSFGSLGCEPNDRIDKE